MDCWGEGGFCGWEEGEGVDVFEFVGGEDCFLVGGEGEGVGVFWYGFVNMG